VRTPLAQPLSWRCNGAPNQTKPVPQPALNLLGTLASSAALREMGYCAMAWLQSCRQTDVPLRRRWWRALQAHHMSGECMLAILVRGRTEHVVA